MISTLLVRVDLMWGSSPLEISYTGKTNLNLQVQRGKSWRGGRGEGDWPPVGEWRGPPLIEVAL